MDVRNIRLLEVFWKPGDWVEKKALSLWCCGWGRDCVTHVYVWNPKWKWKCKGNQAINFVVSLGGFFLLSPYYSPYYHALPKQMCWLWYCIRREAEPWHCLSFLFLPANMEGSFSLLLLAGKAVASAEALGTSFMLLHETSFSTRVLASAESLNPMNAIRLKHQVWQFSQVRQTVRLSQHSTKN